MDTYKLHCLLLCVLLNITVLSAFEFHISPRKVTVRPGERTSILCRSSVPLTRCRFLLPGNRTVDLSAGANTPSTAEYRYYGRGLENGQCGITLTLDTQVFSAVACQGRNKLEGWKRAAMFLRVTKLPTIQWDIDPQQSLILQPGQNVSLLCLSDVPLETCRFGFMKEDVWLDLSLGSNSRRTSKYAYYGSGLEQGHCGITLYHVSSGMNQELRCVGIGERNEWAGDFFSLGVAKEPDVPKLSISSSHYHDGDTLSATCIVSNSQPVASITWYLGNEEVHGGITDESPDDVWFDYQHQTVVQRLTRRVSCKDNGKQLKCTTSSSLTASEKVDVRCQTSTPAITPPVLPPAISTPIKSEETSNPILSDSSTSCGIPLLSNQLVVNGQETLEGHWPWIAALFVKKIRHGGLEFLCGGTLINKRHIITAAHCVNSRGVTRRADDIVLFLGKFDLNDWTEPNSQLKRVQAIHVHPDYVSSANGSDIAVISLAQPCSYDNYVRPICLWNKGTKLDEVVGEIGTVVGWGRFGAGDATVSDIPRLAKTVIVSQDECLRSHPDFVKITSRSSFCAGYKDGSGPCNGDSGSGLILPDHLRRGERIQWFLRGIVSLALFDSVDNVCDLQQYIVYTDVAKYSDWLLQFTNLD